MITLKQLAELSGLSVRTVGRVLNNQGYVAPEKRALVQELAKQHHYTPNLAARNLRLQNKKFVGIISGMSEFSANARKLSRLTKNLTLNGCWPLLGCAENPEVCKIMLREWSALAEYVVILQEHRPAILDMLCSKAEKLPIKLIFADCLVNKGCLCIEIDRAGSVCAMIGELAKMQFKHLLYCGKIENRLEGVKLAQAQHPAIKISYLAADPEFADGCKLGSKIMQSNADVVFFDTDRMAMGFYRYAAEHQISIPQDISVVGFDDEELSALLTPGLSTIAHPREEIADTVVKLIITGKAQTAAPIPMQFIKRASIKNSAES